MAPFSKTFNLNDTIQTLEKENYDFMHYFTNLSSTPCIDRHSCGPFIQTKIWAQSLRNFCILFFTNKRLRNFFEMLQNGANHFELNIFLVTLEPMKGVVMAKNIYISFTADKKMLKV